MHSPNDRREYGEDLQGRPPRMIARQMLEQPRCVQRREELDATPGDGREVLAVGLLDR